MTNNLKMINRLTELMNDIDTIKEEIKGIIIKLENDPIADIEPIYNTSKNNLCTNVINKFLRENGTTLNQEQQKALFSKISYCNVNKLSMFKLLQFLEFEFEYIESDKQWKDMIINIKDTKNK